MRTINAYRALLASASLLLIPLSLSADLDFRSLQKKSITLGYNFRVKGIATFDCGINLNGGSISLHPDEKLLVNEINPVAFDEEDNLVVNDDGITCFSGHVGVNPERRLLVNEINPVTLDEDGICVVDDMGITNFSGNVGVAPGKILMVNEINPTIIDEWGGCAPDDNGQTSFSGGLHATKDLTVDGLTTCSNTIIDGHLTVYNGMDVYNHTCFHNEVGIHPKYRLLTNEINPCTMDESNECIADDSTCAKVHISGDLAIRDRRQFGQNNNIYLETESSNGVLTLQFNNTNNDTSSSNLSRGAFVKCRFFGTGEIGDEEEEDSFFDVFYEVDLFVTPGLNGQSGVIGTPIIRFGHTSNVISISTQFSTPDTDTVTINLVPSSQVEADLYNVWGTLFYEVVSDNIADIICPASNPG